MRMRTATAVTGVLAAALLISTGCVSKKIFRDNSETQAAQASSMESAVEANERRISDLSADTDRKISAVDGRIGEATEIGARALAEAASVSFLARSRTAKGNVAPKHNAPGSRQVAATAELAKSDPWALAPTAPAHAGSESNAAKAASESPAAPS